MTLRLFALSRGSIEVGDACGGGTGRLVFACGPNDFFSSSFFFSPFFFFSLLPYLLPGGTVGASLVPCVPDVVYPFE